MLGLVCGKNGVIDALKNHLPIETLYMTAEFRQKYATLFGANLPIKIVTGEELNQITQQANHQGVAARLQVLNFIDFATLKRAMPLRIVVLDHITDPQNLGAILRAANAFGFRHIIVPSDRSVAFNSTALRVSSGGFVGLKITRVNSLQAALVDLKQSHYWIYASNLGGNAKMLSKVTFNTPTIVIIGNEGKGVSKTLLNLADEHFYIPMQGTVQSLNVAVAAGIVFDALANRSE